MVVLFFGDHWPNLEEEYLTDLLGTDSTSLGLEDMMREYQVPFVIWANYPLKSQEIEAVSLNYLSGLLLRAAGLEGTDYTKFLEQLRQEVPVITAVGTMDKDGNLYAVGASTPYDDLPERLRRAAVQQRFWGQREGLQHFYPVTLPGERNGWT